MNSCLNRTAGEFGVSIELAPGTSIEQNNQTTLRIERIFAQMPEIEKVFTGVGSQATGSLSLSSNNLTQINVTLVPKEKRKKSTSEVGEEIKSKLKEIPGMKVYVNPIGLFGSADQAAIQIAINGTDFNEITKAAMQVEDVLKSVPGTTDVRLSSETGKPEMRIAIDRAKMAQLGLSVADVGTTLRIALTGDDQSKYRDGNTEYVIRIRFDEFNRTRTDDIGSIVFVNNRGQQVELQQFATISLSSGPTKLERRDRIGIIYVNGQTLGRPTGTIMEDFKNRVAGVQLPPGITLSYLGMEKMRAEGFTDLFLAMLTGILFIYLIMVALYDSYVYPFVVLFSIPLGDGRVDGRACSDGKSFEHLLDARHHHVDGTRGEERHPACRQDESDAPRTRAIGVRSLARSSSIPFASDPHDHVDDDFRHAADRSLDGIGVGMEIGTCLGFDRRI